MSILAPLILVAAAGRGEPARAARTSVVLAVAASLDRPRPSEIETAIRADPELSADDRRLSALYSAAKAGALGTGSSEPEARRRFLNDLRTRCAAGAWKTRPGTRSLGDCIGQSYRGRLEEVAIAALFTDHDLAMDELTRQDPRAALIEEAVYQYATIEDPAARARRVAAIIAPVFDWIRIHPAQTLMGRRVAPFVDVRLEHIATATDAAGSDAGFSDFLYAASGWTSVGDTHPGALTIPCAALVRRPGLLAAFGERHGPGSDCETELPPTPRLDALIDAAIRAQPPCGGTIVQDTGSLFEQMLIGIRLDIHDAWRGAAGSVWAPSEMDDDQKRFRASQAGALRAAVDEMTAYYAVNFRIAPAAARTQAKQIVDITANAPFDFCQ